jgi:hypothetical protein
MEAAGWLRPADAPKARAKSRSQSSVMPPWIGMLAKGVGGGESRGDAASKASWN